MIPRADAIVTDPPYGETALDWDRWPDGWPEAMTNIAPQMWCFGSMRMFLTRAQSLHRGSSRRTSFGEAYGSNVANDRFRRYELALHFYRGEWGDIRWGSGELEMSGEAEHQARKDAAPGMTWRRERDRRPANHGFRWIYAR